MKSNTLQITSFYQKVLDLKERGRVCMCEFDFTEISFLHCRVLSEFEFIELKKGERESVSLTLQSYPSCIVEYSACVNPSFHTNVIADTQKKIKN